MTGGDGPNSYTHNSWYQRGVIEAAKEMINEGISANLDLIKSPCFNNKFHIADLGCSIGPNTFIAIQNIIDTVQKKYQDENHNPLDLEFQVFFNDQVNNDFNTLFKALPPSRSYFAAGVPGSFHGVLFPNSSLHLVHSSYALHWLSQLPKELVDSKSPAWNKGSIFCSGLVKEVAEVYACQYKKDMNRILNARAQELVPGGLIIILESSLPDDVPMSHTAMGMPYDFLGSCLHDMVKMGLLSEEKVDSFNLPMYIPHVTELKELIEENGCFSIERMIAFDHPVKSVSSPSLQAIASLIRAIVEGFIEKHLGDEIDIKEIFSYYAEKFAKNPPNYFGAECRQNLELFLLLKRKMN
ncbi:probable S-adenosylmethionine-dependent methyltransferase At5g37990 [Carica papaya]|uniref:probable S-adenosylmethionine-dependent methyltransferase At5g37990 n=1 Tax=Carica papaya TaxID=3649 RepID=UPI000B8C956B|nr:probable S-adenosylmethionine-dependent methyltransferase At5g37990 [Carica papaya]